VTLLLESISFYDAIVVFAERRGSGQCHGQLATTMYHDECSDFDSSLHSDRG